MVRSPIVQSITRGLPLNSAEEHIRFFLVFIRELGLRKKSIKGAINPFITRFYLRFNDMYPPWSTRNEKTESRAS